MTNEIVLPNFFEVSHQRKKYIDQFFTCALPNTLTAPEMNPYGPCPELDPWFRDRIIEVLRLTNCSFHCVLIGLGCSGEYNSEWVELIQTESNSHLYRDTKIVTWDGRPEPEHRELILSGLKNLTSMFAKRLEKLRSPPAEDSIVMGGMGAKIYFSIHGAVSSYSFEPIWPAWCGSNLNRWFWLFLTGSTFWLKLYSKCFRMVAL